MGNFKPESLIGNSVMNRESKLIYIVTAIMIKSVKKESKRSKAVNYERVPHYVATGIGHNGDNIQIKVSDFNIRYRIVRPLK